MGLQKAKLEQNRKLRQAVAGWLSSGRRRPDGLAFDVAMTRSSERVDVGALWLKGCIREDEEVLNGRTHGLAVLCASSREECWPECSSQDIILAELTHLRENLESVMAEIRSTEPELRAGDLLFEDLEVWNYEQSANQTYWNLRRRISSLEDMAYKGTRMAHLMERPLVDYLYLAGPQNILQPKELPDAWGLLEVDEKQNVTLIREAKRLKSAPHDRLLFLKRILASSTEASLQLLNHNHVSLKKGTKS